MLDEQTTVDESSTSSTEVEKEKVEGAESTKETKDDGVAELKDAFQAVVREKENRIRELEALAAARAEPEKKLPEVNLTTDDILQNPGRLIEEFRKVVDHTVTERVKDLQDFRNEVIRNTKTNTAVDSLKSDPYFGKYVGSYADEIKQIASSMAPDGNITRQHAETAALLIPGLIARGQLPDRLNKETEREKVTPPHVRSSNPPPPRKTEDKTPTLSDNELRMARALGQSPEEFISLRDAGGDPETWKKKKEEKK